MTQTEVRAIQYSEALHARVRDFAFGNPRHESFEELALSIAEFQKRHSEAFARLVALHGSRLDSVAAIPAIPTDAFRLTRVSVHSPSLDCARFVTSGTTERLRGMHAFRSTRTYSELCVAFGRAALIHTAGQATAVCLAAPPEEPQCSSLSFMFQVFLKGLDGRSLDGTAATTACTDRWLLGPRGINLDGLHRAAEVARVRSEPLLVLSTSLALDVLLQALDGRKLDLPPESCVMQTGGDKGRRGALGADEIRTLVSQAFGLPESAVVSEYGMTELSSQLYEGTYPCALLRGPPGIYLAPPWLQVTPVDPVSLAPVPEGEVGLARFVDLANVDSAVAIVTQDRIRARGPGIELLGRQAGAPERGCSLTVQALLEGNVADAD